MKNVDIERVVIPIDQIAPAQKALQEHVRVLYKDAKWLKRRHFYPISILFFILCMEEIAKFYVIDKCKSDNRDVTKNDMALIYSHKVKLETFLKNTGGGLAGLKHAKSMSSDTMDYEPIAKTLMSMKERAMYFEYKNGRVGTLESILNAKQVSNIVNLLQKALLRGRSVMDAHLDSKPVLNKKQEPVLVEDDFQQILARVMANAQALQIDNAPNTGIVIPKEDFGLVLPGLEEHIGALDEVAAKLHDSKHPEASILISIIALEESSKYYLIAKHRREQCDISHKHVRNLKTHEVKLTAFFKDVYTFLEKRANKRDHYNDPNEISARIRDFMKFNGIKQLAMYFNYLDSTTYSLTGILGHKMTALSCDLRIYIQGIISWLIMSDGFSNDPFVRYNRSVARYRRSGHFYTFRYDPKDKDQIQMVYSLMSMLDCLNSAVREYDTPQCNAKLLEIHKLIKDYQ